MRLKMILLAGLSLLSYIAAGQISIPQITPAYTYESKLCSYTQTRIPVQIEGSSLKTTSFL
jgi:hypothetical protein